MGRDTTVRAQIGVSFHRPVANDVPVELTVFLPRGAKLVQCLPRAGANAVTCKPTEPQVNLMYDEEMSQVFVAGTLKAQQPQDSPQDAGFSFFLDVTGVDGIMVSSTRTRVKVQMPLVYFEEATAPPNSMLIQATPGRTVAAGDGRVTAMAILRDPQQITWSDKPSSTGANVNSVVGWHIGDSSTPANHAVPVTGVRESIVRANADRNFWSGIAFGTAGGAGVALLQGLFVAWLKWRAKPK